MADSPKSRQYRPTKSVPFSLNERIRGILEERLYPQAIESLNGIITPGVSTPGTPPPALIPPHTHIRLLTTLVSHPYLTTQLSKNEPTPTAPVHAFLLLRRILKLIGPLNGDFAAAWAFEDTRVRGRVRTKKEKDRELSPNYTTDDHLACELANSESLFALGEDLWTIVGWAFTCSVSHPKRWKWWKLELEILLDVLEADWEDRQSSCLQTKNHRALQQALIVKMLPDTKGSAGYKKVIRAILANGTSSSLSQWNPIYKDELSAKRPKKKNMGSLDNTFIGDDVVSEDEPTPIKSPTEDIEMNDADSDSEDPGPPSAVDEWGGMDAMVLRQRFLSLLSSVSYHNCYIDIDQLYHEYTETILRFPPSSFALFTSTFLAVEPAYRSSLNQLILETIISSHAPAPREDESDDLTADKLIHRYLPYTANTSSVADNAKVALLLESMLRLLATEAELEWSWELEDAVERGVNNRREKIEGRGRGRERAREEREAWEGAEERLKGLVMVLKKNAGVGA